MRMIVLALALVAVAVQERDLPAGHYCMNHTPAPSQRNAHECHCDYVCNADNTDYTETAACKVYCHREKCTCHPEEPCPKPKPS